jgi:hypothetical protein
MGGDGPAPGGDDGDAPGDAMGIPPPATYETSGSALERALEEAFRGVDFQELEEAWKASILKVGG